MTKRPWGEVQDDLLENVFYAHDPATVLASSDLAKAGMLDSLTIVAILEVLADGAGNDDALDTAEAPDFRDFRLIQALYERL